MSLLRLLAAGRSLIGVKEAAGRYHVTSKRVLPKFSPKANPFRATTRRETGEISISLAATTQSRPAAKECPPEPVLAGHSAAEPAKPALEAASELKPAAGGASAATAPNREARFAPALAATGSRMAVRAWERAVSSAARVTSLVPRPRLKPGKAAGRPLNKPLVQPELSLESIRVVRNDLSDSDLELVTARPPVEARPAAAAARPNGRSVETVWGRMAGRLFGAGKI
jgi:hypothetical protein